MTHHQSKDGQQQRFTQRSHTTHHLSRPFQTLWCCVAALTLIAIPLLADIVNPATVHAAAPTGLHVVGNTLVDGSGAPLLLHGVNRDGTEYACEQGWGISDGPVDAASFTAIAAWHTNIVRIPLNEHCWLGLAGITSAYSGANYQNFIATEVAAATAAGLVAILELHASGPQSATGFVSGVNGQQPMADADYSLTFWAQVASAYKSNTSVIFDLFNEPFMGTSSPSASDWDCWKNGCTQTSTANTSYQTAGMAQLVSTVRTAGAPNVLMLGGLDWAGNESQWAAYKPSDPLNNLAVSWHQYQFGGCLTSACWQTAFNSVQATYPVITGEIGTTDCTTSFLNSVLPWMDGQNMSYLAWTWNVRPDCEALISNYNGTPTSPYGQAYQDHLAALLGLQRIILTPATLALVTGATQQVTATGIYGNGSMQNLTTSVTWNSTSGSVATISSSGLVTGVAPGNTTITATSGGIVGSATLTVTAVSQPNQLSKTWYFAEGYTGPNFNVYYTIFNPGATTANLTVTYYFSQGGSKTVTTHSVPPGKPLTFYGNADVPVGSAFGAQIASDQPVMAERSMYFQLPSLGANPAMTGASDVVGATTPNTSWYFAEGYTGPGFNEFLTMINPNASSTSVTLTYYTQNGKQAPLTFSIPAGQRQTIYVNDNVNPAAGQTIPLGIGPNQAVGVSLVSSQGIVAERPMYFSFSNQNNSGGPATILGGHVVMGANQLATTFNFAEGYTGANFNEYLTLINPGATSTTATVTYYVQGGVSAMRTLPIPAGSRQTIAVWLPPDMTNPAGLGQLGVGVSVSVTTSGAGNNVPILVERPIYFAIPNFNGSGGALNQTLTGGTVAIGSNTVGKTVVFATGTTQTNFNEFLTIENATGADAHLTIIYYSTNSSPVIRSLTVPASSRGTIAVFQASGAGLGPNSDTGGVSAVLTSDQPILAERPEYMLAPNPNNGGTGPALLPGGHDAIGIII